MVVELAPPRIHAAVKIRSRHKLRPRPPARRTAVPLEEIEILPMVARIRRPMPHNPELAARPAQARIVRRLQPARRVVGAPRRPLVVGVPVADILLAVRRTSIDKRRVIAPARRNQNRRALVDARQRPAGTAHRHCAAPRAGIDPAVHRPVRRIVERTAQPQHQQPPGWVERQVRMPRLLVARVANPGIDLRRTRPAPANPVAIVDPPVRQRPAPRRAKIDHVRHPVGIQCQRTRLVTLPDVVVV